MMKRVSYQNKQIILSFFTLLLVIILFQVFPIDIYFQNYFYCSETNSWLIQRSNFYLRIIFYIGIKYIIALFAIFCMVVYGLSFKYIKLKEYRMITLKIILALVLIPSFIAFLKKITNIPTPSQLLIYKGTKQHLPLINYIFRIGCDNHYGCGYPAGHASGGFAFMVFYFIFKDKKNKIIGLIFGLILGWTMGFYQVLSGQHFLSHTIVTMIISWIILLNISKIDLISTK